MSHGEIKPGDWQNLVTVRPGPVLHVWRGGADYCAVPLTPTATLALIGHLSAALQMAGGADGMKPGDRITFAPSLGLQDGVLGADGVIEPERESNENLPFAAHKARRDAETAPFREGTK